VDAEMSEQDKRRHQLIGERLAKESECQDCADLNRRLKLAVRELKSTERWIRGEYTSSVERSAVIRGTIREIEDPPKQ